MSALQPNQIQRLEESFQSFNRLSETLENTYHDLEERVVNLQLQLQETQEKRRVENAEHAKLNKRLDIVLKALPAGVIVLDHTGCIVECNPAAIEILGGPLRTEKWRDVVLRCFAPSTDDGLELSLHNGRRVSLSTCPLGDDPGQIVLLNDVTETRKLHEKLNQSKRLTAIGEMAATLAHQIRTPLASGLLCASQLKNQKLEVALRSKLVVKVMSHMRHLENLVNDMLLFSRSDYMGEELIQLSNLFDDIQQDLEAQRKDVNTKLNIYNNEKNAVIVGNRAILLSAIHNLVINALHAVGEKEGEIKIFTKLNLLSTIDICVVDNGKGIELENRERIFEPFFTTRTQGTGLGLAIVQAIIRAHHGEIWLESNYDKGTMFVIRLPVKIAAQVDRQST